MATTHYNLPTVSDTDKIDGANQLTALAEAVDAALYQLAQMIPSEYVLPIAAADVLGGIKVGENLSITPEGVLSADSSASVPIASASTAGIVKVGTGLTIAEDGLLSVDLSALVAKGTTWGDISSNGFLYE